MFEQFHTTVNRRQFLKTTATTGIVGGAIQGVSGYKTSTDQSPNPVKYVKYLLGNPPNRTKVFGEVSQQHWAVRFTAKNLQQKISKQIRSTWGEDTPIQTLFGPMPDSPTGFGIKVYYTDYYSQNDTRQPNISIQEVRDRLPNQGTGTNEHGIHAFKREGIPIKVFDVYEQPVGCSGENSSCQAQGDDYYPDFMPGGVSISNGTSYSTLAAPFYETDTGYGKGWIGSGHSMEVGDDIYHPNEWNGDSFGTCKEKEEGYFNDIEWSFIEKNSDEATSELIANPTADGGFDYPIAGIVTDNELINDVGTTTTYYSQGRATCRISYWLKDTGGFGTSFVTYHHDIQSGDSGGPLFKLNYDNEALIAAKHTAEIHDGEDSDACGDDAKGTTAETVEEKAGGYFMT